MMPRQLDPVCDAEGAALRGAEEDCVAENFAESGFMLLGAIVMIFLVLLVLSVAAPRIALSLKRDREVEAAHRANQYVRAIEVYYLKFGHYPSSMEQLEKTNNIRFLRQRYVDPLTGKPDWRLIHLGENKTKVKGFFGEDLPGLPGGLGSAAGMASPTGGSSSAFPNSPGLGGGQNGVGGTGTGTGPGIQGAQGPGAGGGGLGATPGGTGSGGLGGTGAGGAGTTGTSSDSSSTSTGGVIIGVGSARSGDSILVVNEMSSYQEWEFLFDPRIEQMKAKSTLLGGMPTGGASTGLGTSGGINGTSPGFGTGLNAPGATGNPPATPTQGTPTPP